MRLCADCGHYHNAAADRVACAAMHGRMRAYPEDIRDPDAMCALCGYVAPFSILLEHFKLGHYPSEIPRDGRLVRQVRDVRPGDAL